MSSNSNMPDVSFTSSLASFFPAEMTPIHYVAIGMTIVWLCIIVLAKFKPDLVSKIPMGDKLVGLLGPKKQVCFEGESCVQSTDEQE